MTWLSYFTKSANLLLILPLILTKFEAPEIAVWYLFATILAMSVLADFGFRSTFIRLVAHAFGGAKEVGIYKKGDPVESDNVVNWDLIEKLYSAMKSIYFYTSSTLLVILFTLGSLSVMNSISHVSDDKEAWLAWIIFAISIGIYFYGKIYSNYLEGLFKIALVRRVEFFFKLGSIITCLIVLLFAPTLLNLVIAQSVWMIINVIRNYYLASVVFENKLRNFSRIPLEKEFFWKIWEPAWRSGISGLMSNGLTNLTGIIYAQIGNPAAVAAYMIALRIVSEIRNVSNAPFYTKIPLLARLRTEQNYERLIILAQKGMFMAHIVFVGGTVIVGLTVDTFLNFLGSNITFVDPGLWLLLSIAFYIHRYGALHMQLYLTTNHVISHKADAISGILFIFTTFLLIQQIDLYAIPVGMLVGYLGFYAWYAVKHSLKSIEMGFLRFEYKASFIPVTCYAIYIIFFILN
jgi:O-antigen/teichoic acid export membrane protein